MAIKWVPLNRIPADFRTHDQYVQCLRRLSDGVSMTCPALPAISRSDLKLMRDKSRLVSHMKDSIQRERQYVTADEEYSLAAVLWFPVKAYYLLYHVLCLIDFLLTANRDNLRMGHGGCLKAF